MNQVDNHIGDFQIGGPRDFAGEHRLRDIPLELECLQIQGGDRRKRFKEVFGAHYSVAVPLQTRFIVRL